MVQVYIFVSEQDKLAFAYRVFKQYNEHAEAAKMFLDTMEKTQDVAHQMQQNINFTHQQQFPIFHPVMQIQQMPFQMPFINPMIQQTPDQLIQFNNYINHMVDQKTNDNQENYSFNEDVENVDYQQNYEVQEQVQEQVQEEEYDNEQHEQELLDIVQEEIKDNYSDHEVKVEENNIKQSKQQQVLSYKEVSIKTLDIQNIPETQKKIYVEHDEFVNNKDYYVDIKLNYTSQDFNETEEEFLTNQVQLIEKSIKLFYSYNKQSGRFKFLEQPEVECAFIKRPPQKNNQTSSISGTIIRVFPKTLKQCQTIHNFVAYEGKYIIQKQYIDPDQEQEIDNMDIDYKDKNRLKYPHFVYSYEKYLEKNNDEVYFKQNTLHGSDDLKPNYINVGIQMYTSKLVQRVYNDIEHMYHFRVQLPKRF